MLNLKVKNYIGYIEFNQPDSRNALSQKLVIQTIQTLKKYEKDPLVKVIILSGAGMVFSSGGDLSGMDALENIEEASKSMDKMSELTTLIQELDKYVIAAVHGFAAGAGFSLALAADALIADSEAKFIMSFVHVGLMPDLGLMRLLLNHVSPSTAKEWITTGKVLLAKELVKYQMINRLTTKSVIEEAESFAENLISGPQLSNLYVKRLINQMKDLTIKTALTQENIMQATLMQTEDFKEGKNAFLEKRQAKFK